MNYKLPIADERIRRAAKKIAAENPEAEFDGGFKVFKLGDKNSEPDYVPNDGTISDNDILSEAVKAAGLTGEIFVTDIEILGGRFRIVGDNDIIVAENPGTTMEQAKEIVKMCPKNIVLINADNDVIAFITKYLQGHRKIFV